MQQSSWECHSEKCYYVYTVHQKQLGRRLCKQSLFAMLSFIMCIIISWGLTLYQGYIILIAWYPLQPYHKQARRTDFKIICIIETPSLENSMVFCFKKIPMCIYRYIYIYRIFVSPISGFMYENRPNTLVQKLTNPIKDWAQFGVTPILRVWHINSCVLILQFSLHALFYWKKKQKKMFSKSLSWLKLFYIM